MHELTIFTTSPTRLELHFLTISHSSLTTAAPVTMSEEVEGKLISLAADILIDNLVQVNNNKVSQTLPRESLAFIQIWCHIFTCGEAVWSMDFKCINHLLLHHLCLLTNWNKL